MLCLKILLLTARGSSQIVLPKVKRLLLVPVVNQGEKSDGNRPSTTILGTRLDPYTLGQLVALYEHKVFTMGAIWQLIV